MRARIVTLVMIGAMVGATTGLAIAALDGAHRTTVAYTSMRSAQDAADVIFFPSQKQFSDADVTKLGQLEEVAAWGGFSVNTSQIDGLPAGARPFLLIGDDWFRTIERAQVVSGRLLDPTREDEAVITEGTDVEAAGLHVGSMLTWHNLSPADAHRLQGQVPPNFDWATEAHGPTTTLHIVGVVRLPMDFVTSLATGGLLLTSPAWTAHHADDAVYPWTNAFVRLQHGAADVPAFTANVASTYGRADIPIKDLSEDINRVQRSLDLEATVLRVFAAAVVLAGLVIAGQAVTRSVRAVGRSAGTLSMIGLDTRSIIGGTLVVHAVAAAFAAAVAVGSAVLFSRLFPIGLGRSLSPVSGHHVGLGSLSAGVVLMVVVMAAVAGGAAVLTVGRWEPSRSGSVLGSAMRFGLSVPAALGSSLALDSPRRSGGSTRSALLASVVGVAGVIAALTFVRGIDDAVTTPSRAGAVWDLAGQTNDDSAVPALLADARVQSVAVMSRFPVDIGTHELPLYSLEQLKGDIEFVVERGRAPRGADEIALAPRTAALLHASIGDHLEIANSSFVMVGVALVSQQPHSSFDEGGWVTPAGITAAGAPPPPDIAEFGLIKLVHPADAAALASNHPAFTFDPPAKVPDVENLQRVRLMPLYLAAFLVLLALGAVAHALLVAARRRLSELAICRALGLTPWQSARCVGWQAAIIAATGLLIGLPVGVVFGRQLWRILADSLSLVDVGPLPGWTLLTAVPITCVLVVGLAIRPALRASDVNTAEVLRRE